jgi:subtilisin family serine protease
MKSSAARWLAVSLALAAGVLLAGPGARAQEIGPATLAKIEPWVMENTRAGVQAELFVVLEKQADLAPAAKLKGKLSKGTFVYQTLFQTAQEAQKPIRDLLDARGVEYRPFYLVNAILVEGDRTLAQMLAARPDVRRIEGNPEMRQALPEPEPADPEGPDVGTDKAIQKAEPGIAYVRAPQVWDLGYTGQGVVVAGADTGYRWTHAALKKAYRGWNGTTADHDYNWHDAIHRSNGPCKGNSPQPCDDFGHGTHTMGTLIGLAGANRIGMAPGARWIGCRNMDQGAGTPASYIECMEFFLAPYPVHGNPGQGDPGKAPHVTSNSWTCPASEGCTKPDVLLTALANLRAAGIVVVASAGNSGPDCSTISDPPTFYDPVLTVGALTTGTDNIVFFSGRGPVKADRSNRLKPDVSAPGTKIRSASVLSNTGYVSYSGTSMAAPHVAGGAALLLSAFPSLAGDVDGIESRLTSSAHPIPLPAATCTSKAGAVPNNVYGFGRLDMGCAIPAKVSGSTTLCSGGTATLTVTLVGKGPWTLTWSDGFVQSGVLATPATRSVSPTATTTYSLTRVASAGCSQPGAGSATVSIAAPLTGGCGETLISSPSAAVAALLSWRLARAALPIGPGIL